MTATLQNENKYCNLNRRNELWKLQKRLSDLVKAPSYAVVSFQGKGPGALSFERNKDSPFLNIDFIASSTDNGHIVNLNGRPSLADVKYIIHNTTYRKTMRDGSGYTLSITSRNISFKGMECHVGSSVRRRKRLVALVCRKTRERSTATRSLVLRFLSTTSKIV